MNCRTIRFLSLVSCAAIQWVAFRTAGEEPSAYAPVIAASDQRREAARRALADERAKRDALTAKQEAVEKEIGELAERLGVASDTTLDAINDRIEAAQTRVRDIDAAIQPRPDTSPASAAEVVRVEVPPPRDAAVRRDQSQKRGTPDAVLVLCQPKLP